MGGVKETASKERKTVIADQLLSFIQRIERLLDEKKAIGDDVKKVYAEAQANGFDQTAMREIVKLRKLEPGERQEHQAVLQAYMEALGMVS